MDKPIVKWLLGVGDNSNFGLSIRKVIAVWVMVLITRIHNKYLLSACTIVDGKTAGNFDFAQTLLYVDYIAIGVLLGLILWQDLAKFRMSGKVDPPADPSKDENKQG